MYIYVLDDDGVAYLVAYLAPWDELCTVRQRIFCWR